MRHITHLWFLYAGLAQRYMLGLSFPDAHVSNSTPNEKAIAKYT